MGSLEGLLVHKLGLGAPTQIQSYHGRAQKPIPNPSPKLHLLPSLPPSKRTPSSEEAFMASSKVERGAVAAVRRYPESVVVMVADASAHLAGAGDGGWWGEPAPRRRGAHSKKMQGGAADVHGKSQSSPGLWQTRRRWRRRERWQIMRREMAEAACLLGSHACRRTALGALVEMGMATRGRKGDGEDRWG